MSNHESPVTHGPPRAGREDTTALALHLHRYLQPVMHDAGVDRVYVVVGFAGTDAETLSFGVDKLTGARRLQTNWTMDGVGAAMANGQPLAPPEPGASPQLGFLPLRDVASGGADAPPDGPLGYLAVSMEGAPPLDTLARSAAEAVRAAQRNSVRLALEGRPASDAAGRLPIKDMIYRVFDHLPLWLGVDHSAALLVTHDPADVVDLQRGAVRAPTYDVMAERLFTSEAAVERLVGMKVPVGVDGLLSCALSEQLARPELRHHRFLPTSEENHWRAIDTSTPQTLAALPLNVTREPPGRVVLAPLIAQQVDGERKEVLGWLELRWRRSANLPASAGPMVGQIADALAERLRASALYALGAAELQLLESVREDLAEALAADTDDVHDTFIRAVVTRVAEHTDLPSFSIGRTLHGPQPTLRFVHAHGWKGSDNLEVRVHGGTDSGIVGLAVRMARPIVLTGGSATEQEKAWKNTNWVNEAKGEIVDARQTVAHLSGEGWRRLADYYISAHEGTYATLAFPILFGGAVLGVIAVEVERTTTWLWWSGLGSQLFYRLLASELAMAFKVLDGHT